MITITRFVPDDLIAIAAQPAQPDVRSVRAALGDVYEASGRCFTVRDCAGAIVMCAGALETHPGYATLWSAIAEAAGPCMVAITRRVRWFAAGLPHARVDTIVRGDFAAGRRWVGQIGFREEATLPLYFEDGGDAVIYRYFKPQGAR